MAIVINDLQVQKQTLQNQLLLMKSSTNSAAASGDTCEALEKQLADVSAKLQAQKNAVQSAADQSPRFDFYKKS